MLEQSLTIMGVILGVLVGSGVVGFLAVKTMSAHLSAVNALEQTINIILRTQSRMKTLNNTTKSESVSKEELDLAELTREAEKHLRQ